MHVAEVREWQNPPAYKQVSDPPRSGEGEVCIKVEAVGIHRVVRARASGQHYSAKTLPHVPGVDGVGLREDGTRVYFTTFAPGAGGSLSEYVNVAKHSVFPLPDGSDPVQVAALVNPALSSWLALVTRVKPLPENFSVLIIGASSVSGRIAISIAKALGARRVIGCARNASTLAKLGLDETITLAADAAATDFSSLGDVDVVLDYVYGPVTEGLFAQFNSKRPTTYVQIGTLAASTIKLSGDLLRSKSLTLKGSGPGSWTMQESAEAMPGLMKIMPQLPKEPVKTATLSEIESVWTAEGSERLVITL